MLAVKRAERKRSGELARTGKTAVRRRLEMLEGGSGKDTPPVVYLPSFPMTQNGPEPGTTPK